tara:strand:+ start:140 stop:331 length:192 start_codon:yes stop_codon:yes gene_type:complete
VILAKYDALTTNYKNIYRMLKKTGYQIYSCYSNEFDKNILIPRPFQKNLFEVDRILIDSSNKL